MRYSNRWEMPEVTFYEVAEHGFEATYGERTLFAYGKPGETNDHGIPKTGELFESLDRAMIAWVAEKYTGPRGAGGTGVGTAADWFARMIGMDQWIPIDHANQQKVAGEVLVATRRHDGPVWGRAAAMVRELEARGLTIAAKKDVV